MTNVFFDLDFVEGNKRLELLSIGMYAEQDGKSFEYYAINKDSNVTGVKNLLVTSHNVHPNILEQSNHRFSLERYSDRLLHSADIQRDIEEFLSRIHDPILWAYYSCLHEVVLTTHYYGGNPAFGETYPFPIKSIYELILRYGLNAERYKRNFPIYTGVLETNLDNAKWNSVMHNYILELVEAQTALMRALPVAKCDEVEDDLSSLQEPSQT